MDIRLLLAENRILVRQCIVALLTQDPDIRVVGEAATGFEAMSLAEEVAPDVVLMDCSLPAMDGVAACRVLSQRSCGAGVLLFSLNNVQETDDALRIAQAGARGFITLDVDSGLLISEIKHVLEGGLAFSEDLLGKLLAALAHDNCRPPFSQDDPELFLSHREKEVLHLLCQGYPNKQIAASILISENTVRAHIRSLMQKLGAENRTQLAVWALQHGYGLSHNNQTGHKTFAAVPALR